MEGHKDIFKNRYRSVASAFKRRKEKGGGGGTVVLAVRRQKLPNCPDGFPIAQYEGYHEIEFENQLFFFFLSRSLKLVIANIIVIAGIVNVR